MIMKILEICNNRRQQQDDNDHDYIPNHYNKDFYNTKNHDSNYSDKNNYGNDIYTLIMM